MNEINISLDRIRQGEILSNPKMDIQLRRIGKISFAVTSAYDGSVFLAFASSELARYLAQLGSKEILDVKLLNQTPITGDETDETKILQLKLSDGRVLVLNKYDHIYEMEPVILEKPDPILISAHKQWALPPQSIAGVMLLTERMVRTIEDIADEGQHAYLVSVLWSDYRLTLEATGQSEEQRISVEGEFISYTVNRFAHGLYVFDHAQ